MEQVARGWLIYDMTGSPFLLGLIQATRAVPLLFFGVLGGVIADRFDRKRQLILAQLANMVLNLILAGLILSGQVQTWHVFVTAFLAGSVMAFQQPARQSMIPDLVDRKDLMNAIALNSAILNGTRTLGPTVAGMVIAVLNVGGSYIFQAGMFLFATVWTFQLQVPLQNDSDSYTASRSMWGNLTDGFGYVRSNPIVLSLLLVSLIPIVLAQPYSALIPVFAKDIYDIGPAGQGVLLSAPGVGAIVGALVIASWSDLPHKGLVLLAGVAAFGLGLIGFGLSPNLALALFSLFIVGAASTAYRSLNQTLLQTNTEDSFRGRVMSLYLLDRGLAPLGAVLAGFLAALPWLGARGSVEVLGFLTLMFALLAGFLVPRMRRLNE